MCLWPRLSLAWCSSVSWQSIYAWNFKSYHTWLIVCFLYRRIRIFGLFWKIPIVFQSLVINVVSSFCPITFLPFSIFLVSLSCMLHSLFTYIFQFYNSSCIFILSKYAIKANYRYFYFFFLKVLVGFVSIGLLILGSFVMLCSLSI